MSETANESTEFLKDVWRDVLATIGFVVISIVGALGKFALAKIPGEDPHWLETVLVFLEVGGLVAAADHFLVTFLQRTIFGTNLQRLWTWARAALSERRRHRDDDDEGGPGPRRAMPSRPPGGSPPAHQAPAPAADGSAAFNVLAIPHPPLGQFRSRLRNSILVGAIGSAAYIGWDYWIRGLEADWYDGLTIPTATWYGAFIIFTVALALASRVVDIPILSGITDLAIDLRAHRRGWLFRPERNRDVTAERDHDVTKAEPLGRAKSTSIFLARSIFLATILLEIVVDSLYLVAAYAWTLLVQWLFGKFQVTGAENWVFIGLKILLIVVPSMAIIWFVVVDILGAVKRSWETIRG